MAKENVIAEGFQFVKGKSRSKTHESNGSESENKRRKMDKEERAEEIKNMSDILQNIKEQIEIKQLNLRKQKCLNDFSKCDQISGQIGKLLNEKKVLEKQLKHLQKKESKSKWYHSKISSRKRTAEKKRKKRYRGI